MLKSGKRFSYANVASTLALVVALGGSGVAVAAALVPNNSVGSKQVINGSLKNKDLRENTVKSNRVADNSLTTGDVANGTLTHADLTTGPIGVARGYAWSSTASPALNVPLTLTGYVYNSSGGAVTVTRTSAGNYTVTFVGLNWEPGNVQVTAYGPAGDYCSVVGWSSPSVSVACFDDTGAAVDSRFTVAVFE